MPSFASPRAPVTVSFLHSKMAPKAKAKTKAKAKAKATVQKTKAAAADDELQLAVWKPNLAMSGLSFHKKATKMRNLLVYRSSADCKKAYIYINTYHVYS